MATMSFSVPDELQAAFDAAFDGQDKNAVIAQLMREAVEREQRRQRHREAVESILSRHADAPTMTEAEFIAAREEGRP